MRRGGSQLPAMRLICLSRWPECLPCRAGRVRCDWSGMNQKRLVTAITDEVLTYTVRLPQRRGKVPRAPN
jgi:hypothetical protein